jgi:ABC-type lipoprotein release transport system permease subunit
MDSAVDKAAADEMGRSALRVQALEEQGLDTATVNVISQVAGVSVAAPALERKTYLSVSTSQTAATQLPPSVTVLGIDPDRETQLHDMPLNSGRLLGASDAQSALITQTLADQQHLGVGDSISLDGAAAWPATVRSPRRTGGLSS